ncbi:TPR-like protein [Rhizoctonia solani]|uniref:TPR-like protein n=1 Tax=Rhizoctonia solani TaxID=456999 RepID=A0A8H7IHI5_9AGAM|nr:TPR-like protein [Rhizoctonia solani]
MFFSCARTDPDGHPRLSDLHANLGASYGSRYRRFGEISDLHKTIESASRALAITPSGHPDLPNRHGNLARHILIDIDASAKSPTSKNQSNTGRVPSLSLLKATRTCRALADLERVIECHSRAIALTPDGDPNLPDRHAALGVSYSDRYLRLGKIADLEKAIECDSRALALTPDGHPDLPDRHASLAIECDSRALELTPDGHPDLPGRHSALGASYSDRHQRLGELTDLEKVIECHSSALALTPDGHPDLQDRHTNMGVSYADRYQRLGEIADLEKTIEHYSVHLLSLPIPTQICQTDMNAIKSQSSALALTPDGHPDMPDRYSNLGLSYGDRYRHLGEPLDLDKAVEYHSRALDLTPDGHQQLSFRYYNRATSCHEQYQRTNDPSHLDISLHHQRYYDISIAENLALKAASAAILSSEYTLALEWLEHARCVVWNQSLMLRSPVDVLHASHPDLATQLQSISQQLHHVNSQPPSSQSATDTPERRHRLAREYNDLVAQVHKLPGFENFLLPTQTNELIKAARNGPIVVINCGEDRCDALLVMPGSSEIACIPLPGFTGAKAKRTRIEMDKSIRNRRSSERGIERRPLQEEELDFQNVLADLWYEIVKPVLDFLGHTWFRTQKYAAYNMVPNWGTIIPPSACCRRLQPATIKGVRPRHIILHPHPYCSSLLVFQCVVSHLPGAYRRPRSYTRSSAAAGTKQELECIVRHMQGRVGYSQLLGNQATKTGVLDAMEEHNWVHLACHAHQNAHDPTESGFFLHDGTLELALINQRSLKNKGLAFLSACQTATGDEKLPDEAIHLASGMLITGYSSVIATMWSVYDEDAPMVADRVYAQLMKDGKIGNGEAGRALHGAVAELRDKVGEREFSHWVPYIHIGS